MFNNIMIAIIGFFAFIVMPIKLIIRMIKPNGEGRFGILVSYLVGWAVLVAIMGWFVGRDEATQTGESTQEQSVKATSEANSEPKDYSHLVVAITQQGFPKTYNAWGKKWIDEINATMPLAVNHIAKDPKCDEPVDVDLSNERSKPKKEAVFYVDCKNGERFYISQQELKDGKIVTAESDKLADAHKYIRPCVDAIKQQLNYPATFDEKTLSIRAYKGTSGNVVVEVPFTAKNGFGVEIENTGKCIIDTQNNSTVEIF